MNRELARKRPAMVTSAYPIRASQPRADVLVLRNPNRTALASEVARRWRAGEIQREYDLGFNGSIWVARCKVRPPRGWWARHGLHMVGAGTALGLVVAGAWLVLKAVALLAAVLLPGIVILGVVAVVVSLAHGNRYTQNMHIHH